MSDSDYSHHSSDHELPTSSRRPRARQTQAWETLQNRGWDLQEDASGSLTTTLTSLEEASKRRRVLKDTTPLQRGIIRHVLLVLDLSTAMLEKDLRPSRYLVTLAYAQEFVHAFFEQNPISQLGVLGMRDGVAVRISEVSGNPVEHVAAIKALRANNMEPKGNPSLQNALEMARASLYHAPSHGTREVVVVLGALLSSDPGDVYETVRRCVRDRIRVAMIGLAARMHICAEIVARTNQGDGSGYSVAVDEVMFRERLMAVTTPPVVRAGDEEMVKRNKPGLLMMGFPSKVVVAEAADEGGGAGGSASLCACHGKLGRDGYECSRCKTRVCALPATCPSCGLTLILSTHLARSYHHLFPLLNWVVVSWERARLKGSRQCWGCMTAFPDATGKGGVEAGAGSGANGGEECEEARRGGAAVAEGASESGRYECTVCERHFCVDCDVFCHEVVHNCPGCQSAVDLPGMRGEGGQGVVDGG